MSVNVAAVAVLAVFYLAILAVGILAAWKIRVKDETNKLVKSVVAGRDLNSLVAVFTMIATTVGGGFINGSAESIFSQGLLWTQAPLGIFIGLTIGGLVYAMKMRSGEYLTMLDPFSKCYHSALVFLIYLATLTGDLLWTASILNALGSSLSVIADISMNVAVVVSGSVTLLYTMAGCMISVAYTDVLQLFFIVLGMTVSVPFVLTDPRVDVTSIPTQDWLGSIDSQFAPLWCDLMVAMTLGTIPWQAYFQRVLSVRTVTQARVLSVVGGCGALILVLPSVFIGLAGISADWGNSTQVYNQTSLVLPLVIHEFTPPAVSVLALGAISAAVMSSVDSSVLATSSMFVHNIYAEILRPKAGVRELKITQWIIIVLFGAASMVVALTTRVIYGLFILAADIVFVVVLPQLTAVLFFPKYINTAGGVAGFVLGILLRLGAGEPLINLDTWVEFPLYDRNMGQLFPFRTFSMSLSFVTIILVSFLVETLLKTIQRRQSVKMEHSSDGKIEFSNFRKMSVDGEESSDREESMFVKHSRDIC